MPTKCSNGCAGAACCGGHKKADEKNPVKRFGDAQQGHAMISGLQVLLYDLEKLYRGATQAYAAATSGELAEEGLFETIRQTKKGGRDISDRLRSAAGDVERFITDTEDHLLGHLSKQ